MSDFDLAGAYKELEAAAKSGNTAKATELATKIHAEENPVINSSYKEKPLENVAISPAEDIASWVSDKFKPQDPKDVSLAEGAGKVSGSAAAGAAVSVGTPTILKTIGKILPGKYGAAATALGETLGLVPAKERAIRGAAGGAAMGGTEIAGDMLGAPEAAAFGASLVTGGLGETAGSFLAKEGKNLGNFIANASYGNIAGASRALGGMMKPNEPLNEATARKMQDKLFGNKLTEYESTLKGDLAPSTNRIAAQEALRKADPSLVPNGSLKPASQLYRENMYDGVTQAVQQGKTFSSTPDFANFTKKLNVQVALGNVSKGDAQALLSSLAADRQKNPAVLAKYAETVDQRIRQWGKPAEGGQASGAAAIDQTIAKEVRDDLRKAFNGYTAKLGMGEVEAKYRNAYSTEMIAEARDKLPSMLFGFEKGKDLVKITKNMMQDPQASQFIQKAFTQHLAQTPSKSILKEFENVQQSLVASNLISPSELSALRRSAKAVQEMAEGGQKMRASDRLKQMLLVTTSQKLGGAAGAAAGRVVGGGQEQ